MGVVHRKRADAWDWEDVDIQAYSKPGKGDITKRVLVGTDEGAQGISMRFFEVPPLRSSANENHSEQHQVYIVTGEGKVLLGDEWHDFSAGDVVFVPGGEQHQFRNTGDGVLRFL